MKYAGAAPGTCDACGYEDHHPLEGVWLIMDDGQIMLGHAPSEANSSLVAEYEQDTIAYADIAEDGRACRISRCCYAPIREDTLRECPGHAFYVWITGQAVCDTCGLPVANVGRHEA